MLQGFVESEPDRLHSLLLVDDNPRCIDMCGKDVPSMSIGTTPTFVTGNIFACDELKGVEAWLAACFLEELPLSRNERPFAYVYVPGGDRKAERVLSALEKEELIAAVDTKYSGNFVPILLRIIDPPLDRRIDDKRSGISVAACAAVLQFTLRHPGANVPLLHAP